MKKLITIAAALVLTLAFGTTAFAAGPGHHSHCPVNGANAGYCSFVDADNDGICDNCQNGNVHCSNYVDVNNDGICDYCQNDSAHSGMVCANGYACTAPGGYGTGHHRGGHH